MIVAILFFPLSSQFAALYSVVFNLFYAFVPQEPRDLYEIEDGIFAVAVCDCLGANDSIYHVL